MAMLCHVSKEHFAALDRDSGIRAESVERVGLQSVDELQSQEMVGVRAPGLAFPYYDISGDLLGYRIKLDRPLADGGKYLAPKGSELHIFCARPDIGKLTDVSSRLFLTEGEKKALCLRQVFPGAAVASIPGCWGWSKDGRLADIFQGIPLSGRDVTIFPDSDWLTNPEVWKGYTTLAKQLFLQGANVALIKLDASSGKKVGVDDFVVRGGDLSSKIDSPFWSFRHHDLSTIPTPLNAQQLRTFVSDSILEDGMVLGCLIVELAKRSKLPRGLIEAEVRKAKSRWLSTRPKSAYEEREIQFDNCRDDQKTLYGMIGQRLAQVDGFYSEQASGNLVFKGANGLKYFSDGQDFATTLSNIVPFAPGRYDKDGLFRPSGYKILDKGEAEGFIKSFQEHAKLPAFRQYSTSPIMVEDGEKFQIIAKSGYHSDHQVLYDGPNIEPSYETDAIKVAFEYPWATESDMATAIIAALGAVFFRVPGLHPAILTIGDKVNLGKSNYLKSLALLCGKLPGSCDYKSSNDEFSKELLAHLDEDFILIDNIKAPIVSSATLERMITDEVCELRVLGTAKKRSRVNTIQFMASINGGKFSEDLITRSVPLFLSSKRKNQQRDLIPFVRANREKILSQMMGMIQRWIDAGAPFVQVPAFEKFPRWAEIMAGIAEVNGLGGAFARVADSRNRLDVVQSSFIEASYEELDNRGRDSTQSRSVKEVVTWLSDIYGRDLFRDYQSVQSKYNATAQRLSELVDQVVPFQAFDRTVSLTVRHTKIGGTGAGKARYHVEVVGGGPCEANTKTLKTLPQNPSVLSKNPDIMEELENSDTGPLMPAREGEKNNKNKNSVTHESSVQCLFTCRDPKVLEKTQDTRKNEQCLKCLFAGHAYPSFWWSPDVGKIGDLFSYDIETPVTDEGEDRPVVLASAFNGETLYFIDPQDLSEFVRHHVDAQWIAHNAAFDLLHTGQHVGDPSFMFHIVDRGAVTDTQLLVRLLKLAELGNAELKGTALDACVEKYLGECLEKDVQVDGDSVRLTYAKYLGRIREAPREYLVYNGLDTIATFKLAMVLEEECHRVSHACGVDPALRLSHDIQVKTSLAKSMTTCLGIGVDRCRVESYDERLTSRLQEIDDELKGYGYWPGNGVQQRFEAVLSEVERTHHVSLVKTYHKGSKKDVYSSKSEHLESFCHVPFIALYLEREQVAKILSTFIAPIKNKSTVHPTFEVLKATGRTSSRKPNLQNVPTARAAYKDVDIRSCFVARSGYTFYIGDFTGAELVAWAQHCKSAYGFSRMADMINAGEDVHQHVAAQYLGILESQVTGEQRQRFGKLANFGLIGGAGPNRLVDAAQRQGTSISQAEARDLVRAWKDTFPESKHYFADATREQLRQLRLDDKNRMYLLKDYLEGRAESRFGRVYRESELEWARNHCTAHSILDVERVRNCVLPSGRIRAKATYCQYLNYPIQGGQADVTNTVWYRLHRAGFRVVDAVHDEFIVEIPLGSEETSKKFIEDMMISTAGEFYPDVRMRVEGGFSSRWEKM